MAAVKRKPVIISPQAKADIESVIFYLQQNWNQNVIDKFLLKIETFCTMVSIHPHIFVYYSKSRNIRNYAITKQHVIYYRSKRNAVEIITLFDCRQSPSKLRKLLPKNR